MVQGHVGQLPADGQPGVVRGGAVEGLAKLEGQEAAGVVVGGYQGGWDAVDDGDVPVGDGMDGVVEHVKDGARIDVQLRGIHPLEGRGLVRIQHEIGGVSGHPVQGGLGEGHLDIGRVAGLPDVQEAGVDSPVDVLVEGPAGDAEGVLFFPLEDGVADAGVAPALDDVVDGAGGVPVGQGVLAGPEELDEAGHGGHRGAAGSGVGVLHDDAVVGAAALAGGEALEGGAGAGPGVVHEGRRARRAMLLPRGLQRDAAVLGQ